MAPRLLLLLVASAGASAGCAGEAPAGAPTEEGAEVVVENLRLVREADGARAVRGVVVNRSGEERSVQVVIALYDASNERIDEVRVPVEGVDAGSEQGFNWTLDRDAAGASVRHIVLF